MFKSRSVVAHIFRGVLGFGFLVGGLTYASTLGWWTVLPLAGALVCFRGCPMCWTVGLLETVLDRKDRIGCADGSCASDSKLSGSKVSDTPADADAELLVGKR
jgi:hypothetical protein